MNRLASRLPRLLAPTLAVGGAVMSLLAAQPAQACGGFFCNNAQPVNQAAERIIFSQAEDGTVTATIQLQYSGEADSFAWVLPVTGSPEVRVSSNLAFQRLQAATNPQYLLTTRFEGTCRDDFRGGPSFNSGGASSDAGVSFADAGGPPVMVINQGTVGPYDFIVISVDPTTPRPSDTAVEWLRANDYQIDESGAERLDPYLTGGMNLLAFRLTKGNSTGSIRPVQITFGTGQASIPIRPTAVAAVADMGVMVWVLGPHRAVPVNYMSLELNEALINWLTPSVNYNAVVTEAANQAGGQGFVTEMAGAAEPLADTIFAPFEEESWRSTQTTSWAGQEGNLLNNVVNQYGGYDGMRDVLAATVPLPADRPGTTYEDLLSCISCYYPWDTAEIDAFDPAAFLAAVETNVIEPMVRTRGLFEDSAYMTRFYTTMSADEMTRDPAFDFNADLADYSNIHNAERVIECSPSISQFEAPWRVELPSGETVRGTGSSWPFSATEPGMPANARIRRFDTSGEGEIIVDNTGTIGSTLLAHNATIPRPRPETFIGGGGGCSVSTAGQSHDASRALGVLALAGLALVLRRRSR